MQSKSIKNKPVFAAYLNMARQNAFETLCHISKLMGIEVDDAEKEKENRLWEMKVVKELSVEEIKSERKLKLIKLFHSHFPFLKPILDVEQRSPNGYIPTELDENPSEEQVEEELTTKIVYASPLKYYAILENMFRLLNALRNEYTHAKPEKVPLPEKKKLHENVVRYAYNCLDGGRRVVKQRFGNFELPADKDAFAFLTDMNVRYDKVKIPGKFKIIKKKGKEQKVQESKFVEKSDFPYRMKDEQGILSDVGILLFVCLFLHKKYISMFMDKVKPYREGADAVEQKVLLETFSVFRIRLPKERYDSERPEYALGLDMLNELQKCPKELYETFAESDKAKFRVPIKSTSEDVVMDDGVIVENGEVLQIRVQDRFPTMALRYIDQTQAFPKIRFQVSLGHYRYSFYDKQCIDSKEEDRVRVLQKEINGFGLLNEIELKRKEKYASHIRTNDEVRKDTADSEPYITDCYANYVFNGNRIGFLFNDNELGRIELRSMNTNEDKEIMYIPKLEWNKDLAKESKKEGTNAVCVPPIAWLSTYELPALVFHHHLCQRLKLVSPDKKISTNPTEYVIIQCIKTYYRFFNDLKEGRLHPEMIKDKESLASLIRKDYAPLQLKDIPVKLVDYLTNENVNMEEVFKKRAKERMEKMLKGTELRLKMFREERAKIGSKDNKFGKKGYVDIRPGKLADYLAKDMLMFQPVDKDNKNKVTGLNFQVIQASLAIYDMTWEELRTIFENAKLISQKNIHLNHPFLGNLFASKKAPLNTMDFYEHYLQEKINYLKKRSKKGTFSEAFLHKDRMKWQKRDVAYYKALAGRYLEEILKDGHKNLKPIELPRGLFERSIVEILKNAYADESKKTCKKDLAVLVNKQMAAYEKGEQPPYNISFFISAYFTHVLKDKVQPFYVSTPKEYKRTYKFFNIINNQKDRNALVAQYYTQEEFKELRKKYKVTGEPDEKPNKHLAQYKKDAFHKEKKKPESSGKSNDEIKKIIDTRLKKYHYEYDDNERAIRRFMVQDILVFLMAKDLLWKNIGRNDVKGNTRDKIKQYKLQNINPTSDTGNILSLSIPFSLTLTLKDGSTRTITQKELKLKNYGDFFRFVYDERLATLLSQTKSVEINRDDLEKELLHYDLQRTKIFGWVHAMENYLFKQHPELGKKDKMEEGSHYYYAQKVKNKKTGEEEIKYSPIRQNFRAMLNVPGNIPSQHLEAMVEIRNSFCHNHYVKDLNFGGYQSADIPQLADALEKILEDLVKQHSKQ